MGYKKSANVFDISAFFINNYLEVNNSKKNISEKFIVNDRISLLYQKIVLNS